MSSIDETSPILVFDLLSQKMKSTLRVSSTSSIKNFDKSIPTYTIALITLSSIIILLALIYLLYRNNMKKRSSKIRRTEHNGPIREVWSNPDIYNTNGILMDSITRVNIRKDTSNTIY
jgi:hypothetical protein